MNDLFYKFVVAAMDDDEGIPDAAYQVLLRVIDETPNKGFADELSHVCRCAKAQDGRWYLPHDFHSA